MTLLRTALTWDGRPVVHPAYVELVINEGHLEIYVEAAHHGDPPPPSRPGPTGKLWEHEAIELFVCSGEDPPQYTEIELGPYGHYLVLRLVGIRTIVEHALPIQYGAVITAPRWSGFARVPLALLPPRTSAGWRVNATHVWGPPERRAYETAARLTAAEPDFHRPHEFVHGLFPA